MGARYLDTPGLMGRDLEQCRDFATAWFGDQLMDTPSKVSAQPQYV